eukprot:s299_g14.t1
MSAFFRILTPLLHVIPLLEVSSQSAGAAMYYENFQPRTAMVSGTISCCVSVLFDTMPRFGSANSARHLNFGLLHWPSFGPFKGHA